MEKQTDNTKLLRNVMVILLIVGAVTGGILFYQISNVPPQKTQSGATVNPTPTITLLPKEVTVTLSKTGFLPKNVTIKKGSVVRWINDSGEESTVNSDDHPTNQKYKKLNLGTFSKGSSLMLLFDETGTYGYHDHFHPQRTGTVTVIE